MNNRAAAEAEFARRLLPLARRWRAVADKALAEFGVSDATGWVLLHIGRLGEGARQTELAGALDIQGASLVRLIDQLERSGFVERRVDAEDRRVNRVHLSEAGRSTVVQMEQALRQIRHELFEGIGDEDLRTANAMLELIGQRVSARQERAR